MFCLTNNSIRNSIVFSQKQQTFSRTVTLTEILPEFRCFRCVRYYNKCADFCVGEMLTSTLTDGPHFVFFENLSSKLRIFLTHRYNCKISLRMKIKNRNLCPIIVLPSFFISVAAIVIENIHRLQFFRLMLSHRKTVNRTVYNEVLFRP